MPSKRRPNPRLRTLLARSGWSGQNLADAVNAVGAENGLTLRYDRTSVAHWLSGSRPPAGVTAVVAEAFTRRLGAHVSPSDTGLTPNDATHESVGSPADVATHLGQLGCNDTEKSFVLYRVGDADLTKSANSMGIWPPTGASQEQPGTAQIQVAESMLTVFSRTDDAFGGGMALPALSAYLAVDISPSLRAVTSPPAIRSRLFRVAARLAYVAGWMCFDETRHGAGQLYYHCALRLAEEAGDATCHAMALRALSVQARHLGHHTEALHLADAAAAESRLLPPAQAASLAGTQAVALAATGSTREAYACLRTAERLLHRSSADTAVIGRYHAALLAYQQAETLAAANDRAGAITLLTPSLGHYSPDERRAHAIVAARLGGLCLDVGKIEQACNAWSALLGRWPLLSSNRVEQAVRSMRARLRPHSHHPLARALLNRTAIVRRESIDSG